MLWIQLIIVVYVIITAVCVANSKKTQQKIDQKRDERLEFFIYSESVGQPPKVVRNPNYKPRHKK